MRQKIILLLLVIYGALQVHSAESPSQILDKAIANISKASGVSCSIAVSGSGVNERGNLQSSGQKFRISTPSASTWYDGRNMWTANSSSKEITLITPTTQEINEVNPFSYISGYKAGYKVYFSRRKSNVDYLILLNPKRKNGEIKAVEIDLDKKSLLPRRFIVRDRNDRVTTISLTSVTLEKRVSDSDFVCPVGDMTDYELVDLR